MKKLVIGLSLLSASASLVAQANTQLAWPQSEGYYAGMGNNVSRSVDNLFTRGAQMTGVSANTSAPVNYYGSPQPVYPYQPGYTVPYYNVPNYAPNYAANNYAPSSGWNPFNNLFGGQSGPNVNNFPSMNGWPMNMPNMPDFSMPNMSMPSMPNMSMPSMPFMGMPSMPNMNMPSMPNWSNFPGMGGWTTDPYNSMPFPYRNGYAGVPFSNYR